MSICLNLGFVACSPMPSIAARRLMPARIITASWLVKFCTSLAPGPSERLKLPLDRPSPSAGWRARMNSPRALNCWLAAARLGALMTPELTLPAAFFDSYLYVGITLPLGEPDRPGPVRGETPRL